jgi:hypothetical protein
MRTSLTDIQLIESSLHGKLSDAEQMTFHSRLLSDPVFTLHYKIQKRIYSVLRLYNRKKLKEKSEEIHRSLFTDPLKKDFRESIFRLFNH